MRGRVTSLWSRSGEQRTLADGTVLALRPLEPEDGDLLREVFEGLGPRSRELRFLTGKPRLTDADLRQLTAVDHRDHEALVAFSSPGCRPIGVARVVRSAGDPATADAAVAVVDAWQSRGVGTVLAVSLVARARELGIHRISVLMAHDNEAAARLMRRVLGRVEHAGADGETAEYVVSVDSGRSAAGLSAQGA